jgi:uncharacterized OB-fold protein
LGPKPVSGFGYVYTFTKVFHAIHPMFESKIPYIIAIVELDEQPGLRVLSNLINCDYPHIGMRVKAVFEERDGYFIPLFEPV